MGRALAFMERRLPIWVSLVSALIAGAIVTGGWLLAAGRKLQVLDAIESRMQQVEQHETRIAVLEALADRRKP